MSVNELTKEDLERLLSLPNEKEGHAVTDLVLADKLIRLFAPDCSDIAVAICRMGRELLKAHKALGVDWISSIDTKQKSLERHKWTWEDWHWD